MKPVYFQSWLKQNRDSFEGYERTVLEILTNGECPVVRRAFSMVLDYLEGAGCSEQVISISVYMFKRYYLAMAPTLAKINKESRRVWKHEYHDAIVVRAETEYPTYKTLIIDVDPATVLPVEVKV